MEEELWHSKSYSSRATVSPPLIWRQRLDNGIPAGPSRGLGSMTLRQGHPPPGPNISSVPSYLTGGVGQVMQPEDYESPLLLLTLIT